MLRDHTEIFNLETHRRLFYMSRLLSNEIFGQIDPGYLKKDLCVCAKQLAQAAGPIPLAVPLDIGCSCTLQALQEEMLQFLGVSL